MSDLIGWHTLSLNYLMKYVQSGNMPDDLVLTQYITEATICDGINNIGDRTFIAGISLSKVKIGSTVSKIGFSAFNKCINFNEIELNRVTDIGGWVFSECTNLSSIIIPNSVTGMGYDVFYGYAPSQNINIRAQEQPEGWDSDWNYGCNAIINWGYSGE